MGGSVGVRVSILTPVGPGAVAGVLLLADQDSELEALLRAGVGSVLRVGTVSRRVLFGVDDGVVTRWSARSAELMPHGGQAVLRALLSALTERGATHTPADQIEPLALYPEAKNVHQARMLATLARARSPRAVDALLAQPPRWARGEAEMDTQVQRQLRRLVEPALVVALGPANVGKSTLANALAGRAVAVVADEPGTTRDHVGVMIEVCGVVVRYVDTPGIRAGAGSLEHEAMATALELAKRADLLLLCGDHQTPPLQPEALGLAGIPSLRVALRGDRGAAGWRADVTTAAARGEGIAELGRAVAERLVPSEADRAAGCWRFWE